MTRLAQALWVIAPGQYELRSERLPQVGVGQARVRAAFSAVSRGTETLVLRGLVAEAQAARMRCPHQVGELTLPVKYGYCSVGHVLEGPAELEGRAVFCLHPHQDEFVVPAADLVPVDSAIPLQRATLAANMETALNATWDSAVSPGYRVAIVGAGAVGLLIAHLVSQLPGVDLQVVDVEPSKKGLCARLGLTWVAPSAAAADCDVVFHCTGQGSGLQTALRLAGAEASVVELSWYGTRRAELELGGAFHHDRLRIVSSQVGRVAPCARPRWSYSRRLAKAVQLLADERLDALLGAPIAFGDATEALPKLLASVGAPAAQLLRYDPPLG